MFSLHHEESADLGLFPVFPPPHHMTLGRAFNLLVPVYPLGNHGLTSSVKQREMNALSSAGRLGTNLSPWCSGSAVH